MLKVLVTGFEPFNGYAENSSWAVAEKVAASNIDGVTIVAERLPVSFRRVGAYISDAVAKYNPDIVIMLGQSAGIDYIKLERIAINMMDSINADNDNFVPNEEPINKETPAALFTNFPIKQVYRCILDKGYPVKISNSAGLYVCNCLYYTMLMLCNEHPPVKALFVHLPCYTGQYNLKEGTLTMPLEIMVETVKIVIEEGDNI